MKPAYTLFKKLKPMKSTMKPILISFVFLSISMSTAFAQTNDWITFKSPDNDYTITFPSEPTPNHQVVDSDEGELYIKFYLYEAPNYDLEDNLVYSVASVEYPESMIEEASEDDFKEFFRNSVDGAVQNVNGTLLSETVIEFKKYPGRDIKIDFQNGLAILRMKSFLVEKKLYMIQTMTFTNKDDNPLIDQFMDSFTLTN